MKKKTKVEVTLKSKEEEGKRKKGRRREEEISRRKEEIRISWTLESPGKVWQSPDKSSRVDLLESQSKSATVQIQKKTLKLPSNF